MEAALRAQRIEERVGFQKDQAGVTHPHGGIEPLQRLGYIAPLRIDRGVLVGRAIAKRRLDFRQLCFGIRVPAELLVGDCEALLADPVVWFSVARRARTLELTE